MENGKRSGIVIAGGGLAGCLAALAIACKRPDLPLLLLEEGETLGGNRLWTFFENEVEPAHRWLLEPLVGHSWSGYYVAFPNGSRRLRAAMHAIRSDRLDRLVRSTLRPDQLRLGVKIVAVREDSVILGGGERVKAEGAIDARSGASLSPLDIGWQNFTGREYRFARPHGLDRPVLMDATGDQSAGSRFLSCLPFGADRMLIEEFQFLQANVFDSDAASRRIEAYAVQRGWIPGPLLWQEAGSLPIALDGDVDALWRTTGARVAKLGVRGGLFHPATGQALPDAVRTAMLLAEQQDFSGGALHDLIGKHAASLWKAREYYRAFNQALYRDADPRERVRIMARLFRKDPAVIARFRAGQVTMLDRMRIGIGKS